MSTFDDLRSYCTNLRNQHAERDTMFTDMENMYLLEWPERSAIQGASSIKFTIDPDPRNAIQGANRLLTVTEPKIKVPFDANTAEAKQASEAMEKAALAMLYASGKANTRPVWYDAALSALLFAEVHIQVIRTQDLYDRAGRSPAAKARTRRAMEHTPYLFRAVNPKYGYPVWDGMGLRSYYRTYSITVEEYLGEWGELAEKALRAADLDPDADRLKVITAHDYWDLVEHCAWIEYAKEPTYLGKHGLINIPISATVTEGSFLFDRPEQQRQPMLITEQRSGMWNRKNLVLTALFTQVANWGLNPMWVHQKGNAASQLPAIKQAGLLQFVQVENGDNFAPLLNKGLLDPAVAQALEIAERKGEESTMYKSALGGFLGGGSTYSTHALLSQLGRIPLETHRKMTGWALADALRIAFDWMRADGGSYKLNAKGVTQELDPAIIPEYFEMQVDLDVALPQDKLQQANVFNQLTGKVPDRMLVEDILQIGQYESMWEELMSEQAAKAYAGQYLQQMTMMFQQQAQAMQAQQAQQMQGSPTAMLEGGNATGEGIPPELAAMMSQGGQGPGPMAGMTETGDMSAAFGGGM